MHEVVADRSCHASRFFFLLFALLAADWWRARMRYDTVEKVTRECLLRGIRGTDSPWRRRRVVTRRFDAVGGQS